jgi:DNA invertase Pin-like site-specific DNA recombinase
MSDEKKVVNMFEDLSIENNTRSYEVTKVLDCKSVKGVWYFQLRFKSGEIDWVKDEDCNCEYLISEYMEKNKMVNSYYLICRVSTKGQSGPTHVSLSLQEERLRRYCSRIAPFGSRVKVFHISASAYRSVPDTLLNIGESARKGDCLLFYRADRLSRNIVKILSFLEDLKERGIKVLSEDENLQYSVNTLPFIKLIVKANEEAELLGRRVRHAMELKRKRGDEVFGSLPYGWKSKRDPRTQRLLKEINIVEREILDRIKRQAEVGVHPRIIAEKLNKEGIKKRGKQWTTNMVKNLLPK